MLDVELFQPQNDNGQNEIGVPHFIFSPRQLSVSKYVVVDKSIYNGDLVHSRRLTNYGRVPYFKIFISQKTCNLNPGRNAITASTTGNEATQVSP